MPRIYFFKNAVDDDPYVALFREKGWLTDVVPVLEFEYVNESELEQLLEGAPSFSGLVCTSPRAVYALQNLGKERQRALASWRDKPAYVVGPATRKAVESLGLSCQGDEAGNAEALARFIDKYHDKTERPLLFLCGGNRRDELPTILSMEGFCVWECVVYYTHPIRHVNLSDRVIPNLAVFFSPSGVQAVREVWPDAWQHVGCVSIGERTAQSLREAGREVVAISNHPTPEGLMEAINEASFSL